MVTLRDRIAALPGGEEALWIAERHREMQVMFYLRKPGRGGRWWAKRIHKQAVRQYRKERLELAKAGLQEGTRAWLVAQRSRW